MDCCCCLLMPLSSRLTVTLCSCYWLCLKLMTAAPWTLTSLLWLLFQKYNVITRQSSIADFTPVATTWCCHLANDGKLPSQYETYVSQWSLRFSLIVTHYVKKTMSSTKLDVHSILHCRQRRNKPRPQLTCAENFVKFGRVVFETCERTERQTHTETCSSQYLHQSQGQSNSER